MARIGANTRLWCRAPSGWVRSRHNACGAEKWAPKRCRHCAGCQALKAVEHYSRIKLALAQDGALEGGAFLTLSSLPGTSVVEFMKGWQGLVRWLRRRMPRFEFAAIKERGRRSGMLHLHVVVLNWEFVHWRELRAEWERLTGAYMVDIRRLYGTAEGAAGYVSGYVAKSMGAGEPWGKGVTYSRGFPAPPPVEALWTYVETWPHRQAPAGVTKGVTPLGAIVTKGPRTSCACVDRAREASLSDHLALYRLQLGPPG